MIRTQWALMQTIKAAEVFSEIYKLTISRLQIFSARIIAKIIMVYFLGNHNKVTKLNSSKKLKILFLGVIKQNYLKILTNNRNKRKIHLKKQALLFSLFRIVKIIAKIKMLQQQTFLESVKEYLLTKIRQKLRIRLMNPAS